MTTSREQALEWLSGQWAERGIEGVVVKRLNERYRPGVRAWRKVRTRVSTEAVIGAITGRGSRPETLLLGRFDASGRLQYVGRTTALSGPAAKALAAELVPSPAGHPWEGRRFSVSWSSRETLDVALVSPDLVAEISADSTQNAGKWRHPLRFLRTRPDMLPKDAPPFGAGDVAGAG
ncbi:ATP-dependent DNA ligase [Streptomyces triculaminicus]|uniref:ATP-dependent DNA ligase n=1 Tax=Streptomyces triculaminicus TaxID=2816232 RepID=UPI0037D45284